MSWTSSSARRGREGSREAARPLELHEPILVENDFLGTGRGGGEVPEPVPGELETEVEHLGAAPPARSFRFVRDVFGAALHSGFGFVLQGLAGRLFDFFAGSFGRIE